MSKTTYHKPPISFADQLQQLVDRNLTVNDSAKAIEYLSQISYYRLSAYFLPYQRVKDTFDQGTTFKQIIDTYTFDRELRLLVFDCIERIEIAIRTQFIYIMAMKYGDSHFQDNPSLFLSSYKDMYGNTIRPYNEFQGLIANAKKRKKPEVFIKHYMDNYHTPSNPPSWMCFELLTIGQTNRMYHGLKNKSDLKEIASEFDIHPTVFKSWLLSIVYVRNVCAHHSRLWNKDLAIEPVQLKKPIGNWISPIYNSNNSRMFYFLCVLKYLLLRVNPGNRLKDKLIALFAKYPNVPIKYMGIPSDGNGNLLNWENEPIWQ
jgi:abortive infection bacteriophage resistance protein